jgi:hypothetical protein
MNLRKGASNSASNLLPPSLGGPVWPKAIQRSGVEIIFFLFEHRCAALHSDRLPAAQDSPAQSCRLTNLRKARKGRGEQRCLFSGGHGFSRGCLGAVAGSVRGDLGNEFSTTDAH